VLRAQQPVKLGVSVEVPNLKTVVLIMCCLPKAMGGSDVSPDPDL
jgi:hypothetical protein